MLDVERRQQIVRFIESNNGATVAALSERFGVSEATARRDLVQLSRQGFIERAHGGAVPRRLRPAQSLPEPPVLKRAPLQAEEKRRIGRAASKYVQDGDAIILGGGTTTAEMIPYLSERQGLTIITNALNVAMLLAACHTITVIVLGGVLRHSELSMTGVVAEDALDNLRADKLFMGALAIHVDYGLSVDDIAEAQSDRAIIASARELIVLVDHTKFGRVATVRVAPVKRAHCVITDRGAPEADLMTLREQGVLVEAV